MTLKMVLPAPQPVMVIMSLSKGNVFAIIHTSYNGPPDKGGIISIDGCLIR